MQVILTEDVLGLGDIGDTVTVKPGYARNYLIPRGLAFESGSSHAKTVQHKMRQINARKAALKDAAEQKSEEIRNLVITAGLRVGAGGKVFGSIGARDIQKLLTEAGYEYDRRRILISEPIKKVGVHLISLKLHSEVTAQFKLDVESIKATAKQEKEEADNAKKNLDEATSSESDEELEVSSELVAQEIAAAPAS